MNLRQQKWRKCFQNGANHENLKKRIFLSIIFPAVFGEKKEASDQTHLRKLPSVYRPVVRYFLKLFVILFREM